LTWQNESVIKNPELLFELKEKGYSPQNIKLEKDEPVIILEGMESLEFKNPLVTLDNDY